ncbi:MAG: efflux RND transporter periplasmic adaptor subunit [Chloroflexi bacterium]|nr:efflux RND transporter periplasmic adaptor subunit [Chloroflexota bacterium]
MKRRQSRNLLLLTISAILALSFIGCQGQREPTPAPAIAELGFAENYVSATGKVLPQKRAELSFGISGIVEKVLIAEGDRVEAGQLLAVVSAPELEAAPGQAEAALRAAEAELARLEAGARPEEIRQAQVAVALAEEQVAAARKAVEIAKAQEAAAATAIEVAQATLQQVSAGPTPQELQIAREQIEQAKSLLYASQGQRDALGGQKGKPGYQSGMYEAAEGQVFANEDAVQIAELRYRDLLQRPRSTDVAVAAAQVTQAEANHRVAQAQREAAEQQVAIALKQLDQARAQLALVEAPVRQEDLDLARARVEQAKANLAAAEAALSKTQIVAPFTGTITQVDLRIGEYAQVGRPVLALGDLSTFRVETTDLDEIDVARISEGNAVRITFDALPGLELQGKVERIALKAGVGGGGTTYETIIPFERSTGAGDIEALGLRWGMTAFVDIVTE